MSPTQREASGSQQQQEHSKYFNMFKMKSNKELRTELQLGLPGSPQDDEFSPAMQQQLKQQGLVNSTTMNNNNNNNHKKNVDELEKEEVGANVSGFSKQVNRADQAWQRGTGSSSSSSSCHGKQGADEAQECVDKHEDGATGSQSRAPVGWPPVQSFRKNSLNTSGSHHHTKSAESPSSPAAPAAAPAAPGPSTAATGAGTSSQQCSGLNSSQFVKVYMDGVPIGRKVNLRTHSSYEKLSIALEEMFRRFISGQSSLNKAMKDKLLSESKKFNFIYGSDYVLTYEDKDGDLMLVGDVPWLMFVGTVKRLRIMKGSEAIGLAPREQVMAPAK